MNFITCTTKTQNGSCRIIQFVSVHNSEIHYSMSIMSATNKNNTTNTRSQIHFGTHSWKSLELIIKNASLNCEMIPFEVFHLSCWESRELAVVLHFGSEQGSNQKTKACHDGGSTRQGDG